MTGRPLTGPRTRAARVSAPGRPRSPGVAGLLLLGLAGLVAVALARGRPDAAGRAAPVDMAQILGALESGALALGVLLVVALAGMFVFAMATGARPPRPATTWRLARRAVRFVLVVYLVAVATAVALPRWWASPTAPVGAPPIVGATAPDRPDGAVWPLAVLALSVATALYALWRLRETGDVSPDAAGRKAARTLQTAVDRLDAGEPVADVVVRAYQRMEVLFARAGVPRRPAETPGEYLARAVGELDIDLNAPAELAALYEHARFGAHPVAAPGRRAARAALARLARDLTDA